nr:4Fe-4S dicluster domain-containing protein [Ralstonia solanacearum]
MKIRAQVAMVLNLDKCIGCHTCSVTCKNVWTSREGVEYAWFNNVETKPGIGYPKQWENQDKWQGGWQRDANGKLTPRQGGKLKILANLFANPNLPQIDDYYEPFTYNYPHLQNAPLSQTPPTARPVSAITGKTMEKIEWGPNWEDDLAGEFDSRSRDQLFENIQKEMYSTFENTFMMYLPRLCEHCLNPTCVASCPSGSVYKREEDGIVLVDQDKCRGWRMCVSGCPYKKIYFNWQSGKGREMHLLFPAHRSRSADGVLGNLRWPYPLPGRDAVRRGPHRSRRLRGGQGRPVQRAARCLPRSARPGRPGRGGAPGHSAKLDRCRRAVAGLQDGLRVEGGLPAAPGIPHAADGVVHPAAVADPVGRGVGRHGHGRHDPGREEPADSGALSGQSAHRRR